MRKLIIILIILTNLKCSTDSETIIDNKNSLSLVGSLRPNATTDGSSGNTCSDKDNDDYCDEVDFWPFDPEMNEDLWGIINDSDPAFYFTYDIDEIVQTATTNSMLGAIEEFGNWGPIELWVIGQDYEGILPKIKNFCDFRINRGQELFSPFYLQAL